MLKTSSMLDIDAYFFVAETFVGSESIRDSRISFVKNSVKRNYFCVRKISRAPLIIFQLIALPRFAAYGFYRVMRMVE